MFWIFKNPAVTFQHAIVNIFAKDDCVFLYLDNILVYIDEKTAHINDFDRLFKILDRNNLKIFCMFIVSNLEFGDYNKKKLMN